MFPLDCYFRYIPVFILRPLRSIKTAFPRDKIPPKDFQIMKKSSNYESPSSFPQAAAGNLPAAQVGVNLVVLCVFPTRTIDSLAAATAAVNPGPFLPALRAMCFAFRMPDGERKQNPTPFVSLWRVMMLEGKQLRHPVPVPGPCCRQQFFLCYFFSSSSRQS